MRLEGLDYKVIDMHTHMGRIYCMYYSAYSDDDMVGYMDRGGIEFSLSAPNEDLFTVPQKFEMIEGAMQKHSGRIFGYYSINPSLENRIERIENSFTRFPYAGLKLLPDYHKTPLDDTGYEHVLEYANKNNMLVLVHTWGTGENNNVKQVVHVLDRYPNIRLLMGHSIQGCVDEAIEVSKAYPNAYLDICDTGRLSGVVEKMVEKAGEEKVVFGTDWPWLSPEYLIGAVYFSKIDSGAKRLILRDNAVRILKETSSLRFKELLEQII